MKSFSFIGIGSLIVSALLFASFGVWVRVLSQDLLSFQQVFFRHFLALCFVVFWVGWSKPSLTSLKKVSKKFLFFSAISFPLIIVFYTLSVLQTKFITTVFSYYLASIVTSLLIGMSFFQEKMSSQKGVALLITLSGLLAYVHPLSWETLSIGFLFGLLAGACDAVSNSFKKILAPQLEKSFLVCLQMMSGVVISLLLMSMSGQLILPSISPVSWISGAVLAGSFLITSYLTLIGFQKCELNLGTVILSSELSFAVLFSIFLFNERPSVPESIGASLILLAVIIQNADLKALRYSWKGLKAEIS